LFLHSFSNSLIFQEFQWVGVSENRASSDKVKRVIAVFTPFSWAAFHWDVLSSPRRWFGFIAMIVMVGAFPIIIFLCDLHLVVSLRTELLLPEVCAVAPTASSVGHWAHGDVGILQPRLRQADLRVHFG
jgi:hypothetical protein